MEKVLARHQRHLVDLWYHLKMIVFARRYLIVWFEKFKEEFDLMPMSSKKGTKIQSKQKASDIWLYPHLQKSRACSWGVGIPLCVPNTEMNRKLALENGAKYCHRAKAWFWLDSDNVSPVSKWLPAIYNPKRKPPHIWPNLVPQSIWGVNLRNILKKSAWDTLRHKVYDAHGRRCMICGGKGDRWPVECEESWEYQDISLTEGVAHLKTLKCLCPKCHQIKHLGKAQIDGQLDKVEVHFSMINKLASRRLKRYLMRLFNNGNPALP